MCAFGNYYTFYNYYNNNNYYNNYYYNNNFYDNHPYYYGMSNQCVCSDGSNCFGYELANGNDCGGILNEYTNLLAASTSIVSILTMLTFVFSILTCMVVCSSSGYNTTSAPAPTVQTVQMVSPQANPYAVQPGVQMMSAPIVYGTVPAAQPYPTYASTYPGQVVYAAVPPPQQQPQVVYAMAPVTPGEEKALLGVVPDKPPI